MLIVHVVKPDGYEDIYQCDRIEKEPNALILYGDKVALSMMGFNRLILGPLGEIKDIRWDRQVTQPSELHADVRILTEAGAEISKYEL